MSFKLNRDINILKYDNNNYRLLLFGKKLSIYNLNKSAIGLLLHFNRNNDIEYQNRPNFSDFIEKTIRLGILISREDVLLFDPLDIYSDLSFDDISDPQITFLMDTTSYIPYYGKWSNLLVSKERKSQFLFPLGATLEINYECNLKCKHCYLIGNVGKNHAEEHPEKLISIIDKIYDSNIKKITFMGGEPLLSKHISSYVNYSIRKRLDVNIITNGTIAIEPLLKKIYDAKRLTLTFSVESTCAREHNKLRGNHVFEALLDNIRYAVSQDISVNVIYTITRQSGFDFIRCYFLMRRIGVSLVRIRSFLNTNKLEQDFSSTRLQMYVLTIFHLVLKLFKLRTKISCSDYRHIICYSDFVNVNMDGDIFNCNLLPKTMIAGNCFDDNILSIWHASQYRDLYDKSNLGALCDGCLFSHNCVAIQCPVNIYYQTGEFKAGKKKCFKGYLSRIIKKLF